MEQILTQKNLLTEPTEQQLCCCETLGPGFHGPSALKKVQPFG